MHRHRVKTIKILTSVDIFYKSIWHQAVVLDGFSLSFIFWLLLELLVSFQFIHIAKSFLFFLKKTELFIEMMERVTNAYR